MKCENEEINSISPLELAQYYNRFREVLDYVGPMRLSDRHLRDIWVKGIKPAFFLKLVKDVIDDTTNLQTAFDTAIRVCDESNKASLQAQYLVPPTTNNKDNYKSSGRFEDSSNANKN